MGKGLPCKIELVSRYDTGPIVAALLHPGSSMAGAAIGQLSVDELNFYLFNMYMIS